MRPIQRPRPERPARRSTPRRGLSLAALAVLAAAIGLTGSPAAPAGADLPETRLVATTSLAFPTMQAVNAPARIVRIATVPGASRHEAWAIGYTSAQGSGYDTSSSLGQVVFLHYLDGAGWQLTGAPIGSSGRPDHTRLAALAVAPSGEGWAVGDKGVLVHHAAGTLSWYVVPHATPSVPLEAISLYPAGGGLAGYAVGQDLTVLQLTGSGWQVDPAASSLTAAVPETVAPDLVSVSANSAVAWAVTGDSVGKLYVLRRTGGSWQRVSTEPMFDLGSATAQDNSTSNQLASGGAVAISSDGAWVVGKIQPTDSGHPFGDTLTGDSSRPFALHVTGSGVVSYCPKIYSVSAQGSASTTSPCDQGFPLGAFGLTGVAVLGQEVFAGGMGLFHFRSGAWSREPDSVGFLSSIAFSSTAEGWAASTGSNATTGNPLSETLAVGHWTNRPTIPSDATWPDPDALHVPMEGVALSPTGDGSALAVGGSSRLMYVPGFGWNAMNRGLNAFHAIAWPAAASAWAVGDGDIIGHWDGGWSEFHGPNPPAGSAPPTLYGIAFASPGQGWAVGSHGTLLDYASGRWRWDARSASLTAGSIYAVGAFRGGAVAGGEGGVVLVAHGAAWSVDKTATALTHGAAILSAASLPDGTVALGGAGGLVLLRSPQGTYSTLQPAVDGSVIALGLSRSGGSLHVLASVAPQTPTKYLGSGVAATAGWLFDHDASGWHDLQLEHQLTMWVSTDTAAQHDPVLAIAVNPRSARGWAVGGYPAMTVDTDNHSFERQSTTGVLYRVDELSDPAPPSTLYEAPPQVGSGFSFAFLGDSACAAGLCSAAYGSGTLRDAVMSAARQEIELAADSPGGPELALFGGNMSPSGLPDELSMFRDRYLKGWSLPVFGAIGNQDLVSGVDTGQSAPAAPSLPGFDPSSFTSGAPAVQAASTNSFYLQALASAAAPWGAEQGGRAAPAGVHPVAPIGTVNASLAFSHYAFDYSPPGSPFSARFVVVDDSVGSLLGAGQNPSQNSDANSSQEAWLKAMVDGARGRPVIVMMNEPAQNPATLAPLILDSSAFNGDVADAGTGSYASAVLASFVNGQQKYGIPAGVNGSVPVYVSGGAGSPLDGTPPRSYQGAYHAWLLVTVDPTKTTPLGQAQVTVRSFPILQWMAMSMDHTDLVAGQSAEVTALGRLPDSGLANLNGPAPNPSQSEADYMQVPTPAYPGCGVGPASSGCIPSYAVQPYYRFWSENPHIADFVKPCPSPSNAIYPCAGVGGNPIEDGQDGFLCAMNPGTTYINVVVGVHRARQKITVGGSHGGPCNEQPEAVLVQQAQNPIVTEPHPVAPVPAPQAPPGFFHVHQQNPITVVVPPPVPVLAPAPPLTAAGTAAKKEEEREKAFEHSQESGGLQHQAVAYREERWDPRPLAAAGAAALGFLILSSAWVAARRRDPAAATTVDRSRWE